MTTISEAYNPLIDAAINDDKNGYKLLTRLGRDIFKNNKDKCNNIFDGISAAKNNLGYYCQYFDESIAKKVKHFYNL